MLFPRLSCRRSCRMFLSHLTVATVSSTANLGYCCLCIILTIFVCRNPLDVGGRMLVFTYLGLLWGLVCFDLPADASSIYARSMVSNSLFCTTNSNWVVAMHLNVSAVFAAWQTTAVRCFRQVEHLQGIHAALLWLLHMMLLQYAVRSVWAAWQPCPLHHTAHAGTHIQRASSHGCHATTQVTYVMSCCRWLM
jgi:hypothetical protein